MANIPRTSTVFVNSFYNDLERRAEIEKLKAKLAKEIEKNNRLKALLDKERIIKDYVDPKLKAP